MDKIFIFIFLEIVFVLCCKMYENLHESSPVAVVSMKRVLQEIGDLKYRLTKIENEIVVLHEVYFYNRIYRNYTFYFVYYLHLRFESFSLLKSLVIRQFGTII